MSFRQASTSAFLLLWVITVNAGTDTSEAKVALRVRTTSAAFTDVNEAGPHARQEEYVPFHYWWKYEAHVRSVIAGEYSERLVTFAHLQPAQYRARLTRDWVVVLGRCAPELVEALGVQWCVLDHALANDSEGRMRIQTPSAMTPNTSLERTPGR